MASQVQMEFIGGKAVNLANKFTTLRDKYSGRR
jgi:hypothetical protein